MLVEGKYLVYHNDMQPRKKLPKTALPRLFFIDKEIGAGKYPNAPSLAQQYETSISSINRDIAYMRDMLGAPIAYDFYKKGFYYTEKTYRLAAAYATADDLLALGMAKDLLELYKNTPIHEAALNLLENISAPLRDEKNTEWFKDRIVIPKTAYVVVNPEIWNCIVESLRKNKVITFEYLSAQTGFAFFESEENETELNSKTKAHEKINIRRVRPYQLLFDQRAWYLYAYDEDKSDTRIFSLSRISSVILTEKTFSMPKDFDYRKIEGTSYFGIYKSEKPYSFKIAITGDTRWVRERIWAEDQQIKETKNGIELSFTSNQFNKVLEWILFQTPRAKPLSPKLLVNRWTQLIQEAAAIAQG
ncbi:MAG: WYL domain-containing protein [Treponema sp.]|nr:WYL domain-containing protein [Treponema sp.]MCL2252600.1 WYL domain-containing protein [Treponema sp.]